MKPTGKPTAPKKELDNTKAIVVYWDTCVFLAWIKNETRAAGEMAGVGAIARQIQQRQITLITSSITRAEVFQARLAAAQREKFRSFFRRSNVYSLALDDCIADKSAELREFLGRTDFELLLPDAVHLATAIHYRAQDFQTFDGSDPSKKPRDKTKTRCGLLLLNGQRIANKYSIHLRKPNALQLDMLANVTDHIDLGPVPDTNGAAAFSGSSIKAESQ